ILEFVSARFKSFFHRDRHPELHRPAHESPIETFRGHADNGVHHVIEPLRLSNDLRVALKPPLPQLVADHRHGMSVAPRLLAWLEAAAENRMYPDGIKIICGYDAPRSDFGAVADAQSGPHDFGDNEGINERATSLQVEDVGP